MKIGTPLFAPPDEFGNGRFSDSADEGAVNKQQLSSSPLI
jgi:hypothetical protein